MCNTRYFTVEDVRSINAKLIVPQNPPVYSTHFEAQDAEISERLTRRLHWTVKEINDAWAMARQQLSE